MFNSGATSLNVFNKGCQKGAISTTTRVSSFEMPSSSDVIVHAYICNLLLVMRFLPSALQKKIIKLESMSNKRLAHFKLFSIELLMLLLVNALCCPSFV